MRFRELERFALDSVGNFFKMVTNLACWNVMSMHGVNEWCQSMVCVAGTRSS